jgi:hypothetical protein
LSLLIDIEMPGLTRTVAIELDRHADLTSAPFEFWPPRPRRWRRDREPSVFMRDLREDLSISSETLDHPEGWPQDVIVRGWLERAMRFLGENAPDSQFTFHAGWPEQEWKSTIDTDLASFLEMVATGRIRTDEQYTVRVNPSSE